MSDPVTVTPAIGDPPWNRRDIADAVDEFVALYERRPLQTNKGGMQAPHMFATWFIVRQLAPDLIVESGVWMGQGTWILEQACPSADLVCIDPIPEVRTYTSPDATYATGDLNDIDLGAVTDRSLVFFDDHQNAYARLQQSAWRGFRHVIFEDNYPPGRGDCYSLRKAFAGSGSVPDPDRGVKGRVRQLARRAVGDPRVVPATSAHAAVLHRNLEVYAEFPPLFRPPTTRWGDAWDARYPTEEPLLPWPAPPGREELGAEAHGYTWMCYARLRAGR